jgi:hypothetical protein
VERNDTGRVTYALQETAPNITGECYSPDCTEHYVVRLDGSWIRGFHNEKDAHEYRDDLTELINR